MKSTVLRTMTMFFLSMAPFFLRAQITNTYTSSTTWTVPAGVTSISIKVYGGAGGTGGQDCGAGCSNSAGGPVGYIVASYSVTGGNIIGIYPGAKGANGSNNVSGTGGGNGGASSYSSSYNGGIGGNAGNSGSSGGGGGGGAASIVTVNSTIKIIAGGAGGGGGMANQANSGWAGSSSLIANGTSNAGGNGTNAAGDGGGGGGGGGGQYGSVGGAVHAAGGESAGDGGYRGNNSVSGASVVTTNGSIAWTSTGQIEITYSAILPVTWLTFTATKETDGVRLSWSTATEQNTKDYIIQQSTNRMDWKNIGSVPAGNSSNVQEYHFLDQGGSSRFNYYRLLQRDIDGRMNYSKVIAVSVGEQRKLKVYPNPTMNGMVTINLNESSTVQVYNAAGAKVMEEKLSSGEHDMILSQLPKGKYFLRTRQAATMIIIR